jgi:hypothetical protein
MVILLDGIIEHIFYAVKTRKPALLNLARRPTVGVTCFGGRVESLSKRNPAKAKKMLKKRDAYIK